MGIGFRKGARQAPKKTAKALEADIQQLSARAQNAMMLLQMQLQQVMQRVVTLEQQSELLDFRSLATLKVLVNNGSFTNEEHDAMAETLRIEAFNTQSEAESARLQLQVADPDTTLDKGIVYVARVDAFEPAMLSTPAIEATDTAPAVEATVAPNPNAGKKISELSMLRIKVTFGSEEFPSDIEKHYAGAKAGDTVSFTAEIPKGIGTFAGKNVDFKVSVLQLLKTPEPEAETNETADEEATPSDAPKLSVVEETN